jgi:uncharacterized small protein (DUF1192 family)
MGKTMDEFYAEYNRRTHYLNDEVFPNDLYWKDRSWSEKQAKQTFDVLPLYDRSLGQLEERIEALENEVRKLQAR